MPHSIKTKDITLHASFLTYNDADASMDFCRGTHGVDFAPCRSL